MFTEPGRRGRFSPPDGRLAQAVLVDARYSQLSVPVQVLAHGHHSGGALVDEQGNAVKDAEQAAVLVLVY